jgi:universal stress protein A
MKTKQSSRRRPLARAGKVRKSAAKARIVKPAALRITEILVPIDFSEHSREALRYALSFAERFHARLALVHIVEQIVYPGDWVFAPVPGPAFVGERTVDIVARLREFAGSYAKKVVPVVRTGRAWQQIVDVATQRKSSLIISATHGHTGLKHVLLGSVAEKIVRHAPCPVLTVRAD